MFFYSPQIQWLPSISTAATLRCGIRLHDGQRGSPTPATAAATAAWFQGRVPAKTRWRRSSPYRLREEGIDELWAQRATAGKPDAVATAWAETHRLHWADRHAKAAGVGIRVQNRRGHWRRISGAEEKIYLNVSRTNFKCLRLFIPGLHWPHCPRRCCRRWRPSVLRRRDHRRWRLPRPQHLASSGRHLHGPGGAVRSSHSHSAEKDIPARCVFPLLFLSKPGFFILRLKKKEISRDISLYKFQTPRSDSGSFKLEKKTYFLLVWRLSIKTTIKREEWVKVLFFLSWKVHPGESHVRSTLWRGRKNGVLFFMSFLSLSTDNCFLPGEGKHGGSIYKLGRGRGKNSRRKIQ